MAFACSAEASENVPLTRRPVALVLGSETLSVASPAVEMTLAVVLAVYVLATPGVNAPNDGGRAERERERRRDGAGGAAGDVLAPSRTCIQVLSSCALARTFAREAASPLAGVWREVAQRVDVGQRRAVAAPASASCTCRTRSGPAPCRRRGVGGDPAGGLQRAQQRLDLDVRDAVGRLHAGRGQDALVDALAEPRRGPEELPVVAQDLRPLAAAVEVRAPGDRVIAALDVARVGADADRADVGRPR